MIEELSKICLIKENEIIKNTFKLKSSCFAMAYPTSENELVELISTIKKYNYKFIVLGNSSNVILPEYYDGIVIKLDKFDKYEIHDDYVFCESGVQIAKLSNILVNKGYRGLDFACAVPGTVGGSVYGNAGCYGSSISEVLISARVFDGKEIIELNNEDIHFEYRSSLFKNDKDKKYIILSCKFRISKSDKNELKSLVKERNEKRLASQDLSHPSNGSVFRNPEGFAAGKLKKDVKKEYNIDLILEQEVIE